MSKIFWRLLLVVLVVIYALVAIPVWILLGTAGNDRLVEWLRALETKT